MPYYVYLSRMFMYICHIYLNVMLCYVIHFMVWTLQVAVAMAKETIYLCNFRVSVEGDWLCLEELDDVHVNTSVICAAEDGMEMATIVHSYFVDNFWSWCNLCTRWRNDELCIIEVFVTVENIKTHGLSWCYWWNSLFYSCKYRWCQAQQTSPHAALQGAANGEFDGIISELLPIHSESFMTIAETVSCNIVVIIHHTWR